MKEFALNAVVFARFDCPVLMVRCSVRSVEDAERHTQPDAMHDPTLPLSRACASKCVTRRGRERGGEKVCKREGG